MAKFWILSRLKAFESSWEAGLNISHDVMSYRCCTCRTRIGVFFSRTRDFDPKDLDPKDLDPKNLTTTLVLTIPRHSSLVNRSWSPTCSLSPGDKKLTLHLLEILKSFREVRILWGASLGMSIRIKIIIFEFVAVSLDLRFWNIQKSTFGNERGFKAAVG